MGENGYNVLDTKNNKSITELLGDRLQLPVTSGDTLIDYSIAQNGKNGNSGLQDPVGEAGKQSGTLEFHSLNDVLRTNKAAIAETDVLAELNGDEFSSKERKLIDQVTDFFKSIGNLVTRKGFGEVTLTRSGARDSISHGVGAKKKAAFAAVPAVIQNGRIIDTASNWKGRNYDTVVFGGQVMIGGELHDMGVIVKKYDNADMKLKYYLHEVLLTNENGEAASFKTGTSNGYPSDVVSPKNSIAQNDENSNPGLQENVGENGKKNYAFVKKRAGNSPDFDAEWAYYYKAAQSGLTAEQIPLHSGGTFSAELRHSVISAGNNDWMAEQDSAQPATASADVGMDGTPAVQDAGFVRNEASIGLEEETVRSLDRIAKRGGARVEIVDELPDGAAAVYRNGSIRVSAAALQTDREAALRSLVMHELTHHIETSGQYKSFSGLLDRFAQEHGIDMAGMLKQVRADYQAGGHILDEDGARREVVAKFAESYLSSEEVVQYLARENRGLFDRIREFFRDLVVRFKGTQDEQLMRKLLRTFDKALDSVGQNEGNRYGGEQYAIKRAQDGTQFVEVETDILDGVSKKDILRVLSDIVRKKFHNLIEANGQQIGVNSRTVREWVNSKYATNLYSRDIQKYTDKINSFGYADELLKVSRDYVAEGLKHIRKDNFIGFARGKIQFKVGENGYEADIVVGITKNQVPILYDVVNIQNKKIVEALNTTPAANNANRRRESASTKNSIPQTSVKSNGNSDQTSGQKSYGKDFEELLREIGQEDVAEQLRGLDTAAKKAVVGLVRSQRKAASKGGQFGVQTVGFVRNEASAGLEEETVRSLDRIAKRGGARVEIVDELPDGSAAVYRNGSIRVSAAALQTDREAALRSLVMHELTHHIETSGQYKALEQTVRVLSERNGVNIEAMLADIRQEYQAGGIPLDANGAQREYVAQFMETYLSNGEMVEYLARENRGLFDRIREFFRDLVVRFKGTQDEQLMWKLLRTFDKALDTVGQNEGNRYQSEQHLFIGYTADGTEVYETSDSTKKLSFQERKAQFLDLMKNQYVGRTAKFTRNGHTYYALFDENDVRKNIYGDTANGKRGNSDSKGWKAKINIGAEGNIFELVENAQWRNSQPEIGKTSKAHKNVSYWDYYVKTVQIDGRVFDVLANIRKRVDDRFVYQIRLRENKNKAVLPVSAQANGKTVSKVGRTANDSIDQTNANDNGNSDQTSGQHAYGSGFEERLRRTGQTEALQNLPGYQRSFQEQIDLWKAGKMGKEDSFVLGGTPKNLQKLGLLPLPVTINQSHVRASLNGDYKGTPEEIEDHLIPESELVKLPEKIADPIAVIQDKRVGKKMASAYVVDVYIELTAKSGKQVIVPVQVEGRGRVNNIDIDTNALTTIHGNKDAINRLLEALTSHSSEKPTLYYINNQKTTALLKRAGNPIPSALVLYDGYINSIDSPYSPVKKRFEQVTQSVQFKQWFGNWENDKRNCSKVVNEDGSPKVVYRGAFDHSSGERFAL